MITRRQFSKVLLAAGTATVVPEGGLATPASTEQSKDQICDLLIKGGTVIDPGRNVHAQLDVAVDDGKIVELSPDIPVARARRVVSAQEKIVTPGLIDVHVHVFEDVGTNGVNADQYCLGRGVTTVVDAGSAGYSTIAGLRRYIIDTSSTRVYALVDIGNLGLVVEPTEAFKSLDWLNPQLTARAAEENKPAVVGIKVRLSRNRLGSNDLEGLKRALQAADASQLPLMVHMGDTFSPLPQIVSQLRKGDILTHFYTGHPHGVLGADGKIIPEVLEARERGVLFDVGHGGIHLDFGIADQCLQQNFLPDTISSDLSDRGLTGPVFDLPTVLSKFLLLGLTIDQVIERATVKAAHTFDYGIELGNLRPGTVADISILEIRAGSFIFTDTNGNKRTGREKLQSALTIRAGKLYVNRSEDLASTSNVVGVSAGRLAGARAAS